jgi:hypothetical protein
MKNLFAVVVCFLSMSSFACVCGTRTMTEKYIESDFVAIVTITKIYPNERNSNFYRADIKIDELYKGEKLKSIYVYGRSNRYEIGTSCDIYIPVNTKFVAYADKNDLGFYNVGMCSGLLYLNKTRIKFQENELAILKTLKSKTINFTDKTNYREISNSSLELQKYKGVKLEKRYAIFEIIFETDLVIKKVEIISGFGNPVDNELVEILSRTKWSIRNRLGVKSEAQEESKFLIALYYYEAEKGDKSFISFNYL